MANIGNLIVNVIAKTGPFEAGMTRSRKQLGAFGRATQQTARTVNLFKTALAGIGVGFGMHQVISSLRATAREIDNLAKTSDKLGIATEKLAGLRLAGDLTGVEANTLDMALQRMTRRLAEAGQGTGEALGALKELGLPIRELARMSPDQQFAKLAGAMAKVSGEGDRVRLAFKLFDSEGVALVNTLRLGEQGLKRVQDQARQLGIAIDRDTAAKVENLNDQLTLLGAQWEGVKAAILIDITPAATRAVTALQEVLAGSRSSATNKTTGFDWKGYTDQQFPWMKAAGGWLYRKANSKEKQDRLVRDFTFAPGEFDAQTNFTKRLEAKAKAWEEGPGKGLGISYGEFNRRNQFTPEERQRYNQEANAKANDFFFRDLRKKFGGGLDVVVGGYKKLGEGINAANKYAEDWQKKNPLAAFWNNPLVAKFRGDLKRPPLVEIKEDEKTKASVSRDTNKALIKGTLEAFAASRANLLPKQQLEEAKRQTGLLHDIARATTRFGAAEVGLI